MTRIIRYLEASGSQTAGWYLYVDGTVESAIDFAQADATQFVGKETIWLDGATPSDVDAITGGGGNDVFLAKSDLDTDVLIEDTTGENILVFEAGFVATKVELVSASVFGGSLEQLEISFASAGSAGTTRKITVKSLDTIKFQLGADGTAITAAAFATANPSGFTVATSNDAPIIAEGDSTDDGLLAVNVAEGSTAVATIAASDADNDALTYTLSGTDAALFAVSAAGVVTFKTAPTFDSVTAANNVKTFTLTVTDDGTGALTDSVAVTVTITDVNYAPVFTEGDTNDDGALAVSVTEGATAIITLAATDADAGASLTYSVSGGRDMGLFEITSGTTNLVFKTAPDFESPGSGATTPSNTYVVEVSVTDGTATDTLTITVTVTNANDVTLDFSAAVTPIVENVDHSSTAADVAVLTSTDDSGATVSYKIVTSASDVNAPASTPFSIVESGGRQILRYTGPALNYEATASLVVYVEATSSDGDTAIKAINVGVTNANDAPILVANEGVSFNADETSITLTRAHLLVSDEDSGDTITFTIVAPDFGALKLSGTVLRTGDTFTMDDVTAGKVTYEPTAGTPTDAILGFTYSDGTFTSALQTFKFDVREKTAVEVGDNALDLSSKKVGQEVITDDGQDQITDGQGNDYIEAGRGDDTVDLSTGGADTIAYNFEGGEDGLVGTDGNTRVSGFTRGEDKILFKTDASETEITTLNAFLKDGQGKPNDDFADDKFIVTIDFEIIKGTGGAANSAVLTGLTFHFRESAVYGGNKLSMPIFQINFATPIAATDDILAALGGASNLDFGRGLALKKLVEVNSAGEVTENYVANILGADSIDFVQDEAESLTLTGDAGDNVLTGGALDDTLSGLGGDDTLYGLAGDDKLYGGAGDDTLDGGTGANIIDGGDDDDTLIFVAAENSSDLTLSVADTTRWKLDGTSAEDIAADYANYDYQRLAAGDKINYFKNIENFRISGGDGDDTLIGGAGDDWIYGGDGDDWLAGKGGNDIIDGGADTDRGVFDYGSATADLTLDTTDATRWKQNAEGTWSSGTGAGYEYQRLVAGDETDYFKNIETFFLVGGAGNDTLTGGAGDDILDGGAGDDILDGGAGTDIATFDYRSSTSNLTLDATDTTRWKQNADGTWASGTGAGYEYQRLVAGDAITYFKNIEKFLLVSGAGDDTLTGGAGDDTLIVFAGDSTLTGGDGNDELIGGYGDDMLNGGAGNDKLFDSAGTDTFDGGADDDTAFFNYGSFTANLTLDVTATTYWKQDSNGDWTQTGATSADYRRFYTDLDNDGNEDTDDVYDYFRNIEEFVLSGGDGIDWLIGGAGDDTLNGGGDDDRLEGGDGDNILRGGAGDDWLIGGAGNDKLYGGDGDDTLNGGAGDDILDGGDGDFDEADFDYSASTINLILDLSETIYWRQDSNGDWTQTGATATDYRRFQIDISAAGDGSVIETDYFKNIEHFEIIGGSGDDILIGGAGYDTLIGGAGNDILYGRDSETNVVFDYSSATENLTLDLSDTTYWTQDSNGDWTQTGATSADYQRFQLDVASDGTIDEIDYFKNIGELTLIGGSGDDILTGDGYNSTLNGGAGNDILDGGDRYDKAIFDYSLFTENLTLDLSDTTRWKQNSNGTWASGTGAGYEYQRFQVDLDGDGTIDETDYYKNIESLTVFGGSGDDTLTTSESGGGLEGEAGDDTLTGLAGDDWFDGGAGNDILDGGAGDDWIWFSYWFATSDLTLDTTDTTRWKQNSNGTWASGTGAGYEYQRFVADGETDYFKNMEGFGIFAGSGDDVLTGGDGGNTLYGEAGNDIITGGDGYDSLDGEAGNDILDGGAGDNYLTGGVGDDIFVLSLSSTGNDFTAVLDFSNSTGNDDKIRVDTTNGNESSLAALKAAANIYWTNNSDFSSHSSGDDDSTVNDTIIYSTAGTADTSDDFALMVLEDYTTELTFADFDIV